MCAIHFSIILPKEPIRLNALTEKERCGVKMRDSSIGSLPFSRRIDRYGRFIGAM